MIVDAPCGGGRFRTLLDKGSAAADASKRSLIRFENWVRGCPARREELVYLDSHLWAAVFDIASSARSAARDIWWAPVLIATVRTWSPISSTQSTSFTVPAVSRLFRAMEVSCDPTLYRTVLMTVAMDRPRRSWRSATTARASRGHR